MTPEFVAPYRMSGKQGKNDAVDAMAICEAAQRPRSHQDRSARPLLLAWLDRSGDLTAVRVPGPADEAVRDLMRAREDGVRECRNARHRFKSLLLRNGIAYACKSSWMGAHLRWLSA